MLSNKTVVERFRDGKTGRAGNIFAEERGLYSYGHHWPLAVRLSDDSVLLNGDRYHRPTTNHHAGLTFSRFPDAPRVAWSAMRAAGLLQAPFSETMPKPGLCVVHHTEDLFLECYPGDKSWDSFFATLPVGCTSGEEQKGDRSGPYRRWAHRIGSVVLRYDGVDYLSSMDEGNYFLARLPHRVRTVDGAFLALQPPEVRRARAASLNVLRQGEWFFIPTTERKQGLVVSRAHLAKPYDFPRETDRSNIHRANRAWLDRPRGLYAAGMVRHLSPGGHPARVSWGRRVPSLHHPLRLPKGEVFQVVRNTATSSWSAEGGVD